MKERKTRTHVPLNMGQRNIVTMSDKAKITDLDIQALIDNELSPEEEKRVMAIIMSRPDLVQRYNMYMHQKNLLKMWHKDN